MTAEPLQHGWDSGVPPPAGSHAQVHLRRRHRGGDPPRPLPPPAPPRAAQDGGALAQEPRPDPRRHRRTRRRLPAFRAALPRRVRGGRPPPGPPPQLAKQAPRPGRPSRPPGGLLPGAPAAQRPRGPGGHRAPDRHPPRPVAGPRLLEKKVALAWRKVGTVPAKGDYDEQREFLDRRLLPRLREAERGRRSVLFVDA